MTEVKERLFCWSGDHSQADGRCRDCGKPTNPLLNHRGDAVEAIEALRAKVDEMKALSQWVRADIEKPDVGEVVYVAVLEDYTVTIADQDVEMTRIAYDLGCVEHEGYGVIAFAYSDSWVVGWKRIEPFTMEEGAG